MRCCLFRYHTPEGYLQTVGLTHDELTAIRRNLMKREAADALEQQERQMGAAAASRMR